MKAITIHQPWASLIAHGHKRYETRSWRTHYRGPIAIHASQRTDRQAVLDVAREYPHIWREISPLPKGCIVAVADLVDCLKSVDTWTDGYELEGRHLIYAPEYEFGDFTPGRYAWELSNVRLIEPIPAKGRQGLWNWNPPEDWKCVVDLSEEG